MSRDIKSEAVRQRIVGATRQLFLEKGYAETTIREISQRARASTGSIYHFFGNKDGIFLQLIREVFERTAAQADEAAAASDDPYLRLALELALVVDLFSADERAASLFAAAYRSWPIQQFIVGQGSVRNRALFAERLRGWDELRYFAATLTIAGILTAQVDERLHGNRLDRDQRIQALLRAVLPVFEADRDRVDATLRAVAARLRSRKPAPGPAAARRRRRTE
jgi:AcrR family transcriptional regulator